MRKLYLAMGLALVAMFVAAGTAFAAVLPDLDEEGNFLGTGFVGKGDVQLALGWNNKQLQDNAGSLEFAYVENEQRIRDCQTTGAPPRTVIEDVTRTTEVNSVVEYDTRNNKKGAITGFLLTGFGDTSEETTFTDADGNPITVGPNGCPSGYVPSGDPVQSSSATLQANGVDIYTF